jgi:hypothetical protein
MSPLPAAHRHRRLGFGRRQAREPADSRRGDQIRRWNAGDGFDKAFCGICGSALFAQNPEERDQIALRMGIIDGDPGVRPGGRQHVSNAAVWEPIPDDGLTRFPGSFREGAE